MQNHKAVVAHPQSHVPAANAPLVEVLPSAAPEPPTRDRPNDDFQVLDVRSIGLTRLINAITFTIIVTVALIGGSILLWLLPTPWKFFAVPLGWLVLGGLCALNVVWWPRWEHHAWSYRVDENVLELRYGVVWHVAVLIPLSRLQHVDLHRGPLERRWGLASLQIHTAGTRDASHRIPGLDVAIAEKLRDQLMDAAEPRTE